MNQLLRTPCIPLSRAWNTWRADRYLDMIFKPLGVQITPMLFAASTGQTLFPGPGDAIRLGTHEVDGSQVEAELTHAGTRLAWHWNKPSPYELQGAWSTLKHGEWGLRFWVVLLLQQDDGCTWHYDDGTKTAHCTVGPRTVALRAEKAPLLITGHDNAAALADEFSTHGYWYLASRANTARTLALRFNLEEAPDNRFHIAIADNLNLAFERVVRPPLQYASASLPAPEAAVRDIMGWNSIWDSVNHRPYITCSRFWDIRKFGGFGFWLNDIAINALLVSLFNQEQAHECLAYLLASATPEGNLPCIVTGNDAWVDRTQAPLVSYIVWKIYQRTGDRSLLSMAYTVLAGNNAWLLRVRDGNGNGLLEYGSSDVGTGLYKGTKLGAKDESFMDNSPMHDEASWNEASRTLDCEDVGLNSLCCVDCDVLAAIAKELGHDNSLHVQQATELKEKISDQLWDEKRQLFANRLWSGKFVDSVTPTSFFPLLAGAATAAQTQALLKHLNDPASFGGSPPLPSVSRSDPAIEDNVYWRGRVWPILNWLVYEGLIKAGETKQADKLRTQSWALFEQSWSVDRLAPENYHPDTGEGIDQPDTDPFYAWTALLAFMNVQST